MTPTQSMMAVALWNVKPTSATTDREGREKQWQRDVTTVAAIFALEDGFDIHEFLARTGCDL